MAVTLGAHDLPGRFDHRKKLQQGDRDIPGIKP